MVEILGRNGTFRSEFTAKMKNIKFTINSAIFDLKCIDLCCLYIKGFIVNLRKKSFYFKHIFM